MPTSPLSHRLSELLVDLPLPFSATAVTAHGETLVTVVGELDRGNVAALRAAVDGRPSRGGSLVLDLSGTTFVDSAGLRLIEELAEAQGAVAAPPLVLVGVSRRVQRTLELAVQPVGRPPAREPLGGDVATGLLDQRPETFHVRWPCSQVAPGRSASHASTTLPAGSRK